MHHFNNISILKYLVVIFFITGCSFSTNKDDANTSKSNHSKQEIDEFENFVKEQGGTEGLFLVFFHRDIPRIINNFFILEHFYNIQIGEIDYNMKVEKIPPDIGVNCLIEDYDSIKKDSTLYKNYLLDKHKVESTLKLQISSEARYKVIIYVPLFYYESIMYIVKIIDKETKKEYLTGFEFYINHDEENNYLDILFNLCSENGKTAIVRPKRFIDKNLSKDKNANSYIEFVNDSIIYIEHYKK